MPQIKNFSIICGHYGCGKTNLSLNLALDASKRGEQVTLVDMDVVNPYFRSSEYGALLSDHGIRLISPSFANTTLDNPALSAEIYGIFDCSGTVIIDAGGDDVGATALGRFAPKISRLEYDMLYVVNLYRPMVATPETAAAILREIEEKSRLKATGVINNSHLKEFTTAETIADSIPYAEKTAELLKLPLKFTTAPRGIASALSQKSVYPIEVYVRTPWGS